MLIYPLLDKDGMGGFVEVALFLLNWLQFELNTQNSLHSGHFSFEQNHYFDTVGTTKQNQNDLLNSFITKTRISRFKMVTA